MGTSIKRGVIGLGILAGVCLMTPARGQDSRPTASESPEEVRERRVMERFLTLLEKTPRRGTALDRVYGYHIERGNLDAFLKTYRDRVAKDPKDGTAWLLLGLFEAQRGKDAAAVEAFRHAEDTRRNDPLPPYYLGQSLVLVGQPENAAAAFERAITRKPARADLLEIFQALGRVYQRAHKSEQALAVWSRLEQLFPDDLRVQEQIAETLAEESQPDQALPRFEGLAKKAKDAYRKTQFQIEAADLKVRLGRSTDALADFERLLGDLNPESWLHREVRRRIEEVFLRNDDQAGLTKYYEAWLKKNPDDVDAMARLGRSLAGQGRLAEAQKWFDQAVKLAPGRKELRQALIEQLVQDKKYAEAAKQYEAMAKTDPANPDLLRDWGRLLLRDPSRPEPERKKAAAAVWNRLVEARPKDAATAVQVADLLRQAGLVDEAIALYKKAIELDPGAPQYREYLGEYYHSLKRSDEALATWRAMAEGKQHNAKNVGRLAEVLNGFGYKAEALDAAAEACKLDPESYELHLKYADYLFEAERFTDNRVQLDLAAKQAADEDEAEAVLDRQIKTDQADKQLEARIAELRKRIEGDAGNVELWRRLARYLEAEGKLPEARAAIQDALKRNEQSVPAWIVAARLADSAGDLSRAADAYRRLAQIDRRSRTDYLTSVARLESRLGRTDRALEAGRDLLAAAPGNLENYQFFSELCFQLGQTDEGLEVLRRAVRLNEGDSKAVLALAETLAQQFRTDEAIEMFWRAFDKATDLDEKLGIVQRLTNLYLQQNQFDRLIARLEREGREADRQRETMFCLAQAHASSGDFMTARQDLERLLSTGSRDTQLLTQLSQLAENEGDNAAAAKYQRQLVDIAPSDEASARLAQLYLRADEISEAEAIWARLASGETRSHQVLMALDSLAAHGKRESVVTITEDLLRKQPSNWELLYRQGAAFAGLERFAEAAQRFEAILSLKLSDDEKSTIAKFRQRSTPGRLAGTPTSSALTQQNPVQSRTGSLVQIRSIAGLETRYSGLNLASWSPQDFGQARMTALAWLYAIGQKTDSADAMAARYKAARAEPGTDLRKHWDDYYLQLVRADGAETFEAARSLAQAAPNDLLAQWTLLSTVPARVGPQGRASVAGDVDTVAPLPPEQLDQVMAAFRMVQTRRPEWISSFQLTTIGTELKRAKRKEQEQAFVRETIASASTAASALSALSLAADQADVDTVLKLFETYERLKGTRSSGSAVFLTSGGYYVSPTAAAGSLATSMYWRANAKAQADVLKILDFYLAFIQRPDQVAQRNRTRTNAMAQSGRTTQMTIWTQKNGRNITVDYPAPNAYLDSAAVQVLREAYELYKRDDLLSDLFAHLEAKLKASQSETEQVYAHLALSALRWWNDEKDEAIKELSQAAKTSGSDPELLLSLAEVQALRNEPAEALAVVDSFEPLDQRTMQRRELLALRLAVLTGDVERARKASERLFGLRLDSETQVQLADQMHQLGMHELSDAVLARARRRAGSNNATLASLMREYQRQNKMDLAVQVAHQLLRKQNVRQSVNSYSELDTYQREAVQVLARSGKLAETIKRLEAQVERSPSAVQLLETLASYYQAAGEKAKVRATYERIGKARPDDARLRFQIGQQLFRSGDAASAVEHFKAAMVKDPSLLGYNYYEVRPAFEQAKKVDDLLEILEKIDLSAARQPWYISRMIQEVIHDPKKHDRGLALFRKAWKAFPDPNQRQNLLANLNDAEINQLPDLYDYVSEMVLPAKTGTAVGPWQGIDQIMIWMGQGKVGTPGTRLLETAALQGKLKRLCEDLQEALKRFPDWYGGKAMLAFAEGRRGRTEHAEELLQALWNARKEHAIPGTALTVMGQEMAGVAGLEDLAQSFFETAIHDETSRLDIELDFNPIQQLLTIYKRKGMNEAARRELLLFHKRPNDRYSFDPAYAAYQRIESTVSMGRQLLDLGYPADAARIYSDLLADPEVFDLAARFGGRTQRSQIQAALNRAIAGLDRKALGSTLKSLLNPEESPGPNAPGVDLVLLVYPEALDQARPISLLGVAIQAAAADRERLEQTKTSLKELRTKHPRDLAVLVADTLLAFTLGDPEAIRAKLDELVNLVEATPLEDLSTGARANARQRAEAARQLGLWVVARECEKKPDLQPAGRLLASRAIEAARRQTDPAWVLAMLREQGELGLERGDKEGAEKAWASMLDLILASPAQSKTPQNDAAGTPAAAPARAPSPAAAKNAQPAPRRLPGVPIITLERFNRATELARMTARKGMVDISLRAMRLSLRGGPPVQPMAMPRNTAQSVIIRSNTDQAPAGSATDQAVESALGDLATLWQAHEAPAADVYEALKEAVLPAARPDEVFLFPHPLIGAGKSPRSTGALLVEWAARAGKLDDLQKAIEARKDKPLAEVPAQVLLVQVGLARRDAALVRAGLEALQARLKASAIQNTAELACHAALPALGLNETRAQAVALLEQAIKPITVGANAEPGASVLLTLARDAFAIGDTDAGRKDVQEYSTALDRAITASGANGRTDESSRRRENALRTAQQFARAGLLTEALEALGQYVDVPWGQYNYINTQTTPNPLVIVARQLMALPAKERYETLKTWTLPSADRKSVRILAAFAPDDVPPPAFGKFVPTGCSQGMISLVDMLIETARDMNALDELEAAVKQAVDLKRDHAETLWLLLQIARGHTEAARPVIEQTLAEWTKPPESPEGPRYYMPVQKSSWPDYLVVRACLANTKLAELGERLALHFPQSYQQEAPFPFRLRCEIAASRLLGAGLDLRAIRPERPPAPWLATSFAAGTGQQWGAPAGWWVVQDGHVASVAGGVSDHLVLSVPLTGRFELSVDSFGGSPALGYAGYTMSASPGGPTQQWQDGQIVQVLRSRFASLSEKDVLRRAVNTVNPGGYNRLTIQSEPGQVRYLVNGHLFYQDNDPSPTSPFLVLGTSEFGSDYRRFSLTGTPEIPREVPLCHADRLEGWISSYYNESVPLRFGTDVAASPRGNLLGSANPGDETDWSARDGIIQGRRTLAPSADGFSLSRLSYHRPIQTGESVSYEFLYEPDLVMVHPALDRLAFLLEPHGVRLRWLVSGPENDASGLAQDNAVPHPAGKREAKPLPLRPGKWNSVRLSLDGDTVKLDLNGERVLEYASDAPSAGRFGFFHDKSQTSCQIRKVVLHGAWPAAISAEMLTDPGASSGEQARARRSLMGADIAARDADWILQQARSRPADRRFDLLARWVLPSEDRPGFRLAGSFTSAFPIPDDDLPAGRRVETGGRLESPASELVTTARTQNRLDELMERVMKATPASDLDRRGQLAMLVLIHVAQDRDREARQALEDLKPLLARLSPDAPDAERWPELLAADAALNRSTLRDAVLALTQIMVVEQIQKEHKRISGPLQLRIRHVHGRAHWLALDESARTPLGTDPDLAAWARVTHPQASSRGQGAPLAHWNAHGGELRHFPGHSHDFMYLRTPLAGNFEVSCELFGWREVELGYGGLVLGLGWDRKDYYVSQLGRNPTKFRLSPPLELGDKPFRLRLVVNDGTFAVYVGDRLIHERGLPPHPDPWLVLHQPAGYMGGVRDLSINGKPAVPDRISLADGPELTGWLADYFEEQPTTQTRRWEKRGNEIFSQRQTDAENSKLESVLFYHRPMLEDGELSYEFYHDPGKVLVHPALDRLVFLLDADGVKLHWLTDAQYDHSGLAPDNLRDEADCRRGPAKLPLRAGDWNKLALKVEGDTVAIRLNDELVFERPIESTNQRFFGLFHFADESDVRVRNVVYEGRWPRELPADLGLTPASAPAKP